jgi:glutamate racemase
MGVAAASDAGALMTGQAILPTPILDRRPRLLVFDSGIGGLSVLAAIRTRRPDADVDYVADDAAFPYGDWDETALNGHIVALMGQLIGRYRPDLVVIACNTASTLVLPDLRARHAVPFVGTVPAIKTAAERTRSGLVSVLATPGTVKRDYTRALIRQFATGVSVTLIGSTRLARLAEMKVGGWPVADDAIAAEAAPCFVERDGRRTDTVVLACTHYPFLAADLQRLAPWPVGWIDPAPAIARRVVQLIGAPVVGAGDGSGGTTAGAVSFHTTSGRALPAAAALAGAAPADGAADRITPRG